jgi:hypothetical protein
MCFYYQFELYLLQCNFKKQEVLKQFRIFNGWNTRFFNAKFLKAGQERENLRESAKSAGNKNYSELFEKFIKYINGIFFWILFSFVLIQKKQKIKAVSNLAKIFPSILNSKNSL